MTERRGFLGIPQPAPAPQGGGFRGFFRRGWTGLVRGLVPDNGLQGTTAILGGPATVVGRGLFGAARDAVMGSDWVDHVAENVGGLFNRDHSNNTGSNNTGSNGGPPPSRQAPPAAPQGPSYGPGQFPMGLARTPRLGFGESYWENNGVPTVPRFSWEQGYGQADPASLPYGNGQGMGRLPTPPPGPAPRGRQGFNAFMAMQEAPGAAAMMAGQQAIMAPRHREK